LRALFPEQPRVLFERTRLVTLAWQHVVITAASMGIILAIGLPLGVWLTRPGGRPFLGLASNLLSVGQTFPPVAVLALALPFFGFGLRPTLIALVAYGLLPVTRNVIAGLQGVPVDLQEGARCRADGLCRVRRTVSAGRQGGPDDLREAARGLGMGPTQLFWRGEAPLALPVVLAGVRISATYTVGTATVAPIIGAGGLGVPIIAGLAVGNTAFVLEGAVPVAVLALLTDFVLGRVEARSEEHTSELQS